MGIENTCGSAARVTPPDLSDPPDCEGHHPSDNPWWCLFLMGIDRPPNAMKIYPVGRQRWQGCGPLSTVGFRFGILMRTGLIYRKSLGRACHRQGFSDARFDPGMIFESVTTGKF